MGNFYDNIFATRKTVGFEGTYKFEKFVPDKCFDTNDCDPYMKVYDLVTDVYSRTYENWIMHKGSFCTSQEKKLKKLKMIKFSTEEIFEVEKR